MKTAFAVSFFLLASAIPLLSNSTPVVAQGDKLAILIGVGDYEDPAIADLPYAPEDARLLYQMLVERGDFKASNIRLMVDDSSGDLRPTLKNIREALRLWLKLNAKPGDTVLFYFSGHGAATNDTGYLVPIDATAGEEVPYTSLDLKLVRDRLRGCDASQVVTILDSCFSGLGKATGEGMGSGYAKSVVVAPEEVPEGKVRVTLTSCREQEESWPLDLLAPVSKANRSVFTYYFFAGLEGVADTSPTDGVVTIKEAYSYAADRVAKWAERNKVVQRPEISASPEDANIDIPLVSGAPASLEVVSEPPGAKIIVDDEDTGLLTPATVRPLASGIHSVGLQPPQGFEGWQGQVLFARAEKKRIEAVLKPLSGTLRVSSTPVGAKVLINGDGKGITPAEVALAPGQYTLRLELESYRPEERQVSLAPAQVLSVEVSLIALDFGSISVNASPWAKVFLDGVEAGTTPLTIDKVAVGNHTVRLEYQGTTYEAEVKVKANETASISHSF